MTMSRHFPFVVGDFVDESSPVGTSVGIGVGLGMRLEFAGNIVGSCEEDTAVVLPTSVIERWNTPTDPE